VAGLNLELGASFTLSSEDHCLGGFSTHHCGALDLGILLANYRKPIGNWRNGWLDVPCRVQLFTSFAIGLFTHATHQPGQVSVPSKYFINYKYKS